MRFFTCVITLLLTLIQYPLWFGKGGWQRNYELERLVRIQSLQNKQQNLVNQKLSREVKDLRIGVEALEEHARLDLGMVRPEEVFIHLP